MYNRQIIKSGGLKESGFIIVNLLILPIILIIGNCSALTILLFWIASFITAIIYLRPVVMKCGAIFFFSPCVLTFLYSIFNYITGALYFSTDLLSSTRLYTEFYKIDKLNLLLILTYLNSCNMVMIVVASRIFLPYKELFFIKRVNFISTVRLFFLFAIFLLLHILIINFDALGAKSSTAENGMTATETGLNFPLIVGVIILISHTLCTSGYRAFIRFFCYGFIILTMAIDSVGSKRELFFALLAIIIVEFIYYDKIVKFSFKGLFIGVIVTFFASLYILSASIVRGYGNFGVESLVDAVEYVPQYAQSEVFSEVVGNNFETPYHYATAVLSCNYMLIGKTPLMYGETFLKVFFLPIPRSLFNYKPEKMIDVFTTAYDPSFRAAGGSYPVSFYSECLQNFHFLGLVVVYIFALFFQKIYVKTVKRIREGDERFLYVIPMFALFLQFVRGSGIESLLIYSLMAFFCMWPLAVVANRHTSNKTT